MTSIKLNDGRDMPIVGFGLWKVDNSICADVVYNAIKAGYRLLDGACDYGNEVECGKGVARAIKDGLVKREDLFIVSKLWNTFHEGDKVEAVCRRGLQEWGIDYFDLYLIHFPVALAYVDPAVRYPPGWHVDGVSEIRPSKATIRETWEAMEALVPKGLARSIGVSNFQAQTIYDLLRCATIRPATLQIEHHPYLVQPRLLRLCQQEGIAVTAYSSYGPASFIELDIKKAHQMVPLMTDATITTLAAKYGRTPGQILLRWSTQRGIAVIPKSNNEERMKENLKCTDFDMDAADVETITAMDQGLRFNEPVNYFPTELLHIFG